MKKLSIALMATTLMSVSILASDIKRPECVAPAKPGGGFDLTCRVVQTGLKDQFDRLIKVTFMPGGIGAVAINQFNTTRTDDPNAIVAFSSGSLLNIATGKYGKWTENDVKFLATAGADFGAVVVKTNSKYKTLDELMTDLKKDESSVVVGAGGSVGSQDWMKGALLFKSINKDPKKMRYVAYDGGGDAIAGLLGGSIDVYMGDVGEMSSHLDAGTMRILAVLSTERLPEPFSKYPTAIEQGYDAEWTILRGYYMGKNVSEEAYNTWVSAFEKAYKDPEFKKLQEEKGLFPLNMAGAELDKSVKERIAKLRALAKDAGLIK
ncbi:Bug family tripartite tricarboxylate transporter substrate binding protein [Halarcobacter ebronensis]|uniref:Tricarboxylic transporter n=1 Tax=Halarcobacter ebronensis TaxID=1462615 RepID=A0A4Q1ANZ4_9BACT|nr:tripartite tricarboxylate transporter substrate-binding protein [Halarcobacter ebronensis]QKF83417.1 tripartite tricarboxylate transport protein TctABC, extracytoplasmic tricarboxylate-binding receptor TctC [Halarcobacter ebronensis]RXK05976.1 tricarboxylic transporter [Halarcobacter ebronensis]